MTKFKLFHLKNEMLVANFLANFIGAVLVQALIFRAETPIPDSLFENRLAYWFDAVFTPFAFIFVTCNNIDLRTVYRQYLTARSNQNTHIP